MSIISWIVLGLLAGLIARFILPSKAPSSWLWTILVGIAGGVVGGYIGTHVLGSGNVTGIDLHSLVTAVLGSILVLLAYDYVSRHRI